MEGIFRSRGIKVIIGNGGLDRVKTYYEPNLEILSLNPEVKLFAERFTCLEYAVSEGKVDAVNFHTNCANIDDVTAAFNCKLIDDIEKIFDSSYKPYTLGYRLNGGISIYYYPTIWKDTHFGICGITDKKTIMDQIVRFLTYIAANEEWRCWIINQIPYITKLKGVCITNFQKDNSYKLYYRLSSQGVRSLFKSNCNIEQYCDEYGEVVLISTNIRNGQLDSFNLYFLR